MVNKQKKHKFAIVVDEFGRTKAALEDFLDLLKEEYPFLTQANRLVTKKRVQNAKKGDIIIFGFARKYDFRLVSEEEWEELSIHRTTPLVGLLDEWEDALDLLELYASSNYPNEFDDEEEVRYCRKPKTEYYYIEDCCFDDIIVVTETPKKRRSIPKRKVQQKSSTKLRGEKIEVFHNFVKVGWDVFDIMLNEDDEEYVRIDGNTYWIDRDYNGYGKVSVQ